MARKPIVAGNWKMNKTPSEGEALVRELIPLVADVGCEVVVCPPFPCLDRVSRALGGSNIRIGAQNAFWEPSGAYTGEVALDMLKDLCVSHVIVGHSERRQYFGETDESVNRRAKAILAAGMTPIVCVGETLVEREADRTTQVVDAQVRGCLAGLTASQVAESVIAYEPVWAIGTGKTASDDQAQEVHATIRALVGELFDTATSQALRIQYGGSMKPGNAAGLMARPDIDGGLIGGASLSAEDFAAICKAAGK